MVLEGGFLIVAILQKEIVEPLERVEVVVFVLVAMLVEVMPAIEIKVVNEEMLVVIITEEVEVELEPLDAMPQVFQEIEVMVSVVV